MNYQEFTEWLINSPNRDDPRIWRNRIEFVLEKYAITRDELFVRSCYHGLYFYVAQLILLYRMKPSVNWMMGCKYAIIRGHVEIVKILLSDDKFRYVAEQLFIICVDEGAVQLCETLLLAGVDPTLRNNFAMKASIINNYYSILRLLIPHVEVSDQMLSVGKKDKCTSAILDMRNNNMRSRTLYGMIERDCKTDLRFKYLSFPNDIPVGTESSIVSLSMNDTSSMILINLFFDMIQEGTSTTQMTESLWKQAIEEDILNEEHV